MIKMDKIIKETKHFKFIKKTLIHNESESDYLVVETKENMFGYSNYIIFNSLIDYTQLHRIETPTTIKKIKSIIVMDEELLTLVLNPILKDDIVFKHSINLQRYV